MTEFKDRIEGEIKTHEAEMLKKAVIAKYGPMSLKERINYIMERFTQPSWTASQMFAKLSETELAGANKVEDVKEIFEDKTNRFPSEVISDQ